MTSEPLTDQTLAEIRQRAAVATEGPWWFDEDDNCWRLHGVHGRIPADPIGIPEQVINHQILKAPKRGTTYAEYWPNAADAAFISRSREDIPALLAEIDRLRAQLREVTQ